MRYRAAAFLLAFTTIPASAMPQGAPAQPTPPASNVVPPPAPAGQARQTLTVTNTTGRTIVTLSVSPAGEDAGGQDVLGGADLGHGESAQISFPRRETQCNWDIKGTYDGGGVTEQRNVNLCQVAAVSLTAD